MPHGAIELHIDNDGLGGSEHEAPHIRDPQAFISFEKLLLNLYIHRLVLK